MNYSYTLYMSGKDGPYDIEGANRYDNQIQADDMARFYWSILKHTPRCLKISVTENNKAIKEYAHASSNS